MGNSITLYLTKDNLSETGKKESYDKLTLSSLNRISRVKAYGYEVVILKLSDIPGPKSMKVLKCSKKRNE